jgi:hypothetical protein
VTFCVRYRRGGGEEKVQRFGTALARAMFVISMAAQSVDVLAVWEEAGDAS